ncbi:MAG: hypothetical protein LBF97_00325 [Elusimicrobiota bacterium]|jgi:hypothetical protein|nr:hypothetical protein [Elusimicrobiota bacterium]
MSNITKIEVKDGENTLKFNVRTFKAVEGLDFVSKMIETGGKDLVAFADKLFPLATMLDDTGEKEIQQLDIKKADVLIQNTSTLIELSKKIYEVQKPFLGDLENYQV